MTASAALIERLRRMVAEPNNLTYSDATLSSYIERYPLVDQRGVNPYYLDTSTDPPTQVATVGWYPTYDLAAAAADVWEEKASAEADDVPMPHEGKVYEQTKHGQYMKQARYWRSRRAATAVTLIASPSPNRRGDTWVFNLPESED
jgi:hypothetical protein